jgi:hypothetical protein
VVGGEVVSVARSSAVGRDINARGPWPETGVTIRQWGVRRVQSGRQPQDLIPQVTRERKKMRRVDQDNAPSESGTNTLHTRGATKDPGIC